MKKRRLDNGDLASEKFCAQIPGSVQRCATSIVDDSDAFNTIIKTLIVSWTIGISLLLGGCLWL